LVAVSFEEHEMKKQRWYLIVAVALVATSAALYLVHYAIFRNAHHIYIYFLGDLAFLPIEVLVVTLIVDRLLSERDKRMALEKLNMVIGAFYSEVGTALLRRLCEVDPDSEPKRKALKVDAGWGDKEYRVMEERFSSEEFKAESRAANLPELRDLLVEHRDFMVRLLENPLLLEHAKFTDLLWAVFHLTEELESRRSLEGLPAADMDHLSGDMGRAYGRVAGEWLEYMRHLRVNYPYLFSLAIRLNPFDPDAHVELQ
jgi:hypothetical protein